MTGAVDHRAANDEAPSSRLGETHGLAKVNAPAKRFVQHLLGDGK
jgi:hypothetical protein